MAESMSKTALLVMDVQAGIIDRAANKEQYLANVQKAIDAAHQHAIPVFLIVVGFRAEAPEVSSNNKMFSSVPPHFINPLPIIAHTEEDLVVTKRRVSAFSGSDLEILLRVKHIDHLVLAGITTSGVILSTTCEAADKDYRITILEDLCADADPEMHQILLSKVLPRRATVIKSEQWIEQLNSN
jgi:nicotinamidase-related amidase